MAVIRRVHLRVMEHHPSRYGFCRRAASCSPTASRSSGTPLRFANQSTWTGSSRRPSSPSGAAVRSRDSASKPRSTRHRARVLGAAVPWRREHRVARRRRAARAGGRAGRRCRRAAASPSGRGPNSHLRPSSSWFTCAKPCWWMPTGAPASARATSASRQPRVSGAGSPRGRSARLRALEQVEQPRRAGRRASPRRRRGRRTCTGAGAASSAARSGSSQPLISATRSGSPRSAAEQRRGCARAPSRSSSTGARREREQPPRPRRRAPAPSSRPASSTRTAPSALEPSRAARLLVLAGVGERHDERGNAGAQHVERGVVAALADRARPRRAARRRGRAPMRAKLDAARPAGPPRSAATRPRAGTARR